MEGSVSQLTLAEISMHGAVTSPAWLFGDKQSPLFVVPENVTIMFRGGFGFAQYTIPGVIDTIMGRDSEGEPFSLMLKRHNYKDKLYGPLGLYKSGGSCVNLALQDEPLLMTSGKDTSFVITVNDGERIGIVDIISSESPDEVISITSICDDKEKMKYFETLKDKRKSFCKAVQRIDTETSSRHIYLKEVVDLLINHREINENNQLVVYVSSCQVVDDEWLDEEDENFEENKKTLRTIIDSILYSHDMGQKEYNSKDLSPKEKGFSKVERKFLDESALDYKDQFFGDALPGYLEIPDKRGVEFSKWYSMNFPNVKLPKIQKGKKKKSKRRKRKTKRKKKKSRKITKRK